MHFSEGKKPILKLFRVSVFLIPYGIMLQLQTCCTFARFRKEALPTHPNSLLRDSEISSKLEVMVIKPETHRYITNLYTMCQHEHIYSRKTIYQYTKKNDLFILRKTPIFYNFN